MSITTSGDAEREYERSFNVQMLQAEVFGAVFSALEFRKSNVDLTKSEVAKRGGWKDRAAVTKYMSSPQNWTLETISRFATALEVDFKFVLIDRTERSRCFNAGGMAYDFSQLDGQGQNFYTDPANSMMATQDSIYLQLQLKQTRIKQTSQINASASSADVVNYELQLWK